MTRTFALMPLLLAAAACTTPYGQPPYGEGPYEPSGYPAPYPPDYPPTYPGPGPAPYPQPPGAGDYRAMGTEPFWDLAIGSQMVFNDRGTGATVVQPTPQPIRGVAGETYTTPRIRANIVHARCSDGMSDRSYPDTVTVTVDGRDYRGCGGAATAGSPMPVPPGGPMGEAPSLDRTRWLVLAINGRQAPRDYQYFIDFDGGKLSAKFGCNGLGAGYTQTGSTLDAGVLIGTKMACPDMSWETQGSAILNTVMTVTMIGPARMTLSSSAGTIELLRR